MTNWPTENGEMARLIRAHDWASTPLGRMADWPQSLKTIVDLMLSSPNMMSLVWGDEAIHLYNDSFAELLHEHRTLSLGRSAYDTFARSREVFASDVANGMAGRSMRLLEQRYPVLRHGSLEHAWFDVDYVPVRNDAGDVNGVLLTLKEVTARKLAEQALRESEARHRLMIGSWAQAVWEVDADGVVVADSPSWRAYTGQTLEEWLGDGWLDAIHPDDRAYAERQWREAVAARALVDAEFRLRAPDGGWRWTNIRAAPVFDASGKIEKWAGMNIDIDPRKRAEVSLRRSEARLRALFESIDEGYSEMQVILNEDGHVVDWLHLALNGNFSRVTGIPDITGRLATEVFPNLEGEWFRRMDLAYRTGEPQRFETELAELGRWFNSYVTRLGGEDDSRVLGVFGDITERKLAERMLRESEERQAFLLKLSDALRPIKDPVDIQHTATQMLGEHLRASRVFYVNVEVDGDTAIIQADYTNGVPSRVGQYSLSAFSLHGLGEWRAGRTASTSDVDTDPRYSEAARQSYASVATRAGIGVPLIKEGRLVAILGVNQSSPRHWSEQDLTLTAEIAERTWAAVERARAEAALRESEERFAQFTASSSDGLWIRAAATLAMEYTSPAVETIYGVPRDSILGDMEHWVSLILPEDRDTAITHILQARSGASVTHEFRIRRPSDGALRWIRNTDFPLRDGIGQVQRIGGITQDVTTIKMAEASLRQSEGQLRDLVEGVSQLVWRAIDGGDWVWASPQWTAFTGQAEADSHRRGWLHPVHPDDRPAALAAWRRAEETGSFEAEFRIRNAATGEYLWFQTRAVPRWNARGEVVEWLGTSTDIHQLKALQESQAVMVAELQHRTRNLIAVVHGIADDTMEETGPTEAFRPAFSDRLSALSRVQGLLSRSEAEPITISSLLGLELDALGAGLAGDRVTVAGPEVFLRPSTVQTLALALHELATNARKYGALSHERGRLAVTWSERSEAGELRLVLDWAETGLEHASARKQSGSAGGGYGRELIEQALPHALGARTTYALTDTGLRCTIDLPSRPASLNGAIS